MKNIDKLKSVIQQANPEIMELKFGCEVKVNNNKIPFGTWDAKVIKLNESGWVEVTDSLEAFYPENLIILGRPIRLADVLVAINLVDHSFTVSPSGGFEKWSNYTGDSYVYENQHVIWNLKNDNLDSQTPECIEFLTKLLVK